MFVRDPLNLDEALSLPTCGVPGVWMEELEHFFFSAKVVSELTWVNALTLYSFWEPSNERWMTREEMEEGGMDGNLALQMETMLQSALKPEVRAATARKWKPQRGDWCVDLRADDGDAFYDMVLRVTEFQEGEQVVIGAEYALPTPEHADGRLHLVWQPDQGGPVMGALTKAELLEMNVSGLHLVVTLKRERKGVWKLGSDCPKPQQDLRECPEDLWLVEGRLVRELIFNPAMWQIKTAPNSDEGKSLLGCSSAHLGKLLRKDGVALQKVKEIWQLDDGKATELLWGSALAPKLRSFL